MSISWVSLELSDKCNQFCPMCNTDQHFRVPTSQQILSRSEIYEKLLVPAKRIGATGFVISGGEPTLSKILLDVISDAKELGYAICLASNIMAETRFSFEQILNALDSPKHVLQFSFDSVHEEEMNIIRGCSAYKKVSKNIYAIQKIRGGMSSPPSLHSSTAFQLVNINSILKTVDFLCNEIMVDCCIVQPRIDYRNITLENFRDKAISMNEKEFDEIYSSVISKLFAVQHKYEKLLILGDGIGHWEKYFKDPLSIPGPCGSRKTLFVDPFGNLRGCVPGINSANIKNVSIDDFLISEGYQSYIKMSEDCNICLIGCSV